MKLNESMTKTMIVSKSHTMHPHSPPLTIGGTVLKESDDLHILGVTFDFKMTFEKHLCTVSKAASQRHVILKSWRVFSDRLLLGRCFRGFDLPVFVSCSAVWYSAAVAHYKVLDRVDSGAHFLTVSVFECSIAHCQYAAVLCLLYKIRCNLMHPHYGDYPFRMCQ